MPQAFTIEEQATRRPSRNIQTLVHQRLDAIPRIASARANPLTAIKSGLWDVALLDYVDGAVSHTTGDAFEWLRLDEPVRELYDVLTLPGVRRASLVGVKTDEFRTRVWADPESLGKRRPRLVDD